MGPVAGAHGGNRSIRTRSTTAFFCGEWCIGRIYENRSGPADLRWFWALHAHSKPGSMRISNQVATLDEAKAEPTRGSSDLCAPTHRSLGHD